MSTYPWNYDESASVPCSLHLATEQELKQMEADLALWSPGTFALVTTKGKWQMARHLAYLDRAILESIEAAEAGKQEGLIVSMPPQHGKSELCSRYLPAWYLGRFPDRRVMLASYEADFAASWGRKARDLLERFGRLFGVRVARRSAAASRWDIEGRDGGMVTAGVGGSITGKGAHLLIIDDPIKNDEEARSATHRQKQWDWWQSVATTRLRPDALTVVIQTRWHRDDLTGRILKQAAETGHHWRVVKFPAVAQEEDVLGRQPGEALWPEMYPAERLEKVRASRTPYYWEAMYQQDPQAEGSAEWPEEYFGPEIWFEEWPREWLCKVVALDPSKGTESKFGDYAAFVMLLWGKDGTLYVDADLGTWNCAIQAEMAVDIYHRFQPHGFGVERNQFQELLLGEIERLASARRMLPNLLGINNQVNKLVRIRGLTALLARRGIRFMANSKGARLLVEQLRDFPNADHDDGPDALEMATRVAVKLLTDAQEDWGPDIVYA